MLPISRFIPLAALLILAGCGGNGIAQKPIALTVRFAWPTPKGRLIPTAANGLKVQVLNGATLVAEKVMDRSSQTATFAELPTGAMTVKATAYPNADGTGNAMASAQTVSTIVANQSASVDLTMASTIDHLTISPNPVNLALLALFFRQTTVTAYDAGGAIVLTAPADISYATTNSLLFNVDATGVAFGLVVGSASITATDAMSGKSVTAPVNITLY